MKNVAALVPFCVLVACGSSKPEPTIAKAEDPPPALSSVPEPTVAAPAPSSAPAASAAPAAPAVPPNTGVVSTDTKDDCTPVGVDFEKRARPKLKECYQTGKKKDPSLEGSVKIKIVVDVKGKIKSTKVIEKTLPDAVANCMLGVIKTTPFPEVDKCWDATLTIPITFPTPK